MASAESEESIDQSKLTIKFLVSNVFAGTLIGAKGNAIKELMETTGARISISGSKEFYPGTLDRVLVITGSYEILVRTVAIVWELIYGLSKSIAKGSRLPPWSPSEIKDTRTVDDAIELTTRVTIPAAAGGLILGRSGATLKSITETSGASVQMTNKEEALFTQERILTITGTISQGRHCTELILQKLLEDDEASTYANRGTRYSPEASGVVGARSGRRDYRSSKNGSNDRVAQDSAIGETTITITVPDNLIGNIIGRGGATLREIATISGASIVISAREDSVDGIRVVTITGDPSAAQTAHAFCTEKIRMAKLSNTRSLRSRKEQDAEVETA